MNFTKYSMRSANFEVLQVDSAGDLHAYNAGPVRTYLGVVPGRPDAFAGAYLMPDGTTKHMIVFGDGTAWKGSGTTALSSGWGAGWNPSNFSAQTPGAGGVGSNLYAAEVGVDMPSREYTYYGQDPQKMVQAVEHTVLNANLPYIRDLAILHRVGRILIRTSGENDPFYPVGGTNQNSGGTVTDQWNNVLPPSQSDFIVILKQNISVGGSASTWKGTSFTVQLIGGANADFSSPWRHEAGHSWGMGHWEGGGYPEGPSPDGGNGLSRFSSAEAAKMLFRREDRLPYIDNLGPCTHPVPPRAMADIVYQGGNAAPATLDVLANDSDINGQSISLLSFDATSMRGGSISRSVGTGPGGRDRLVYTPPGRLTNFDYFRYRIKDSAGYEGTGVVLVSWNNTQLFQHNSYGGWNSILNVGNYTSADLIAAGAVIDDASSVRVGPNRKITLFTGDNFTGAVVVKTADDSALGDDGIGDAVKSARVETTLPALFDSPGYSGHWEAVFPPGRYTKADMFKQGAVGDESRAASIQVPVGYRVILFRKDGFKGEWMEKTSSAEDLTGEGIFGKVNSVIVERVPSFHGNSGYGGWAVGLAEGRYTMSQLQAAGVPNDQLSSLRVPAGYRVTLYPHAYTSGTPVVKTGDDSDLANDGIDNAVSSLVIEKTPAFFGNAAYGGWEKGLDEGHYTQSDLTALGIPNDQLSSLLVPFGYQVTLYPHELTSGTPVVKTSDDADLSDDGIDNAVSSLVIVRGPVVFTNTNHDLAAPWAVLPVGSYTKAQLNALGIPDNQISSLMVQPGFRVTLYKDDNFGGTSVIKTADDPDLTDDGMQNVASSVVVEAL